MSAVEWSTEVRFTRGVQSEENLWGYVKRLRFVQEGIRCAYPLVSPESVRILDVGCGNGSQLGLPLASKGYHLTGIDPDAASIAHAAALAQGRPNVRFFCMVLDDLPKQERFDVIILSEVLEHVDRPVDLLAQAVAHLTEGGIVIVTVPNGYGEFEIDSSIFRALRLKRALGWLKTLFHRQDGICVDEVAATDNHSCGHVQFFSYSRLNRIFEGSGLQVIAQGRGTFLCGPLAYYLFARSRAFVEWNSRVTDRMPMWLVSDWHFILKRRERAC